jgi:hypothetical protein
MGVFEIISIGSSILIIGIGFIFAIIGCYCDCINKKPEVNDVDVYQL